VVQEPKKVVPEPKKSVGSMFAGLVCYLRERIERELASTHHHSHHERTSRAFYSPGRVRRAASS
jgi:hypothetical protein